ncbi:MAG: type II toxin-antitoxin system VapC family toxin [Actinomycetota bacterium]|nr:type II toxin-antitoxin system VapC family toxin [Actinomycetota bacterium]
MIVVDTSAVMAALLDEPQRAEIERVLRENDCAMSTATFVELSLVAEGRGGREASAIAHEFLERFQVALMSLDASMARLAVAGWRQYGKGRHRAGLNLGDCYAYALAIELGAPLLFVGDDFGHTDVAPALG